jgi:DNA-binding Lrp family transcriptional regulator
MELDGVDITVTAAQAQILELLGESDDYVTAAAIGEKLKLSVPVVKRLIYNLRGRISKAGLRAQINGYRKLGFRLEAEGEAQ